MRALLDAIGEGLYQLLNESGIVSVPVKDTHETLGIKCIVWDFTKVFLFCAFTQLLTGLSNVVLPLKHIIYPSALPPTNLIPGLLLISGWITFQVHLLCLDELRRGIILNLHYVIHHSCKGFFGS